MEAETETESDALAMSVAFLLHIFCHFAFKVVAQNCRASRERGFIGAPETPEPLSP